jgi:hypothetical protein
MTTRFFFDTEFIEDGKTIDLISLGMVAVVRGPGPAAPGVLSRHPPKDPAEPWVHGEFYVVNSECDHSRADPWVTEHVLTKLPANRGHWIPRQLIRERLEAFVRQYPPPYQFWAYFADYDWVVLCQLFGKMIDLPKGFPMFCHDVKQEMSRLGFRKEMLPSGDTTLDHDALHDAKWAFHAWRAMGLGSP